MRTMFRTAVLERVGEYQFKGSFELTEMIMKLDTTQVFDLLKNDDKIKAKIKECIPLLPPVYKHDKSEEGLYQLRTKAKQAILSKMEEVGERAAQLNSVVDELVPQGSHWEAAALKRDTLKLTGQLESLAAQALDI